MTITFGTYSFAAVAPTKSVFFNSAWLVVPDFPAPVPRLVRTFTITTYTPFVMPEGLPPWAGFVPPAAQTYTAQIWSDDSAQRTFMTIVHPTCIVAYFSIPAVDTDPWADSLRYSWLPYMTLCDTPPELIGVLA